MADTQNEEFAPVGLTASQRVLPVNSGGSGHSRADTLAALRPVTGQRAAPVIHVGEVHMTGLEPSCRSFAKPDRLLSVFPSPSTCSTAV